MVKQINVEREEWSINLFSHSWVWSSVGIQQKQSWEEMAVKKMLNLIKKTHTCTCTVPDWVFFEVWVTCRIDVKFWKKYVDVPM